MTYQKRNTDQNKERKSEKNVEEQNSESSALKLSQESYLQEKENLKNPKKDKTSQKDVVKTLGDVSFFDSEAEKKDLEKPLGKPNEVIEVRSGDKVMKLTLDDNGFKKSFTDLNGDVIEKDGDKWVRKNAMLPNGEEVRFDVDEQRKISIQYSVPKNENKISEGSNIVVRQIQPDGKELVTYKTSGNNFSSEDVTTEISRDGNKKTVKVVKNDQALQSSVYEGDQLIEFSSGTTTYKLLSLSPDTKKEKWQKVQDNISTEFNGKGIGDSNGSVIFRNFDVANQKDSRFAERYLSNGTRINSDDADPPTRRTIKTADGLTIETNSGVQSLEVQPGEPPLEKLGKTDTTITYPDGNSVKVTYDFDGKINSINGTTASGEINFTKTSGQWNDSAITNVELKGDYFVITRGKTSSYINSKAELTEVSENEVVPEKDSTYRTTVQELPEGYQELLNKRLDEARNHPCQFPLTAASLWWLYNKTKDGGDFDDKQKGGQYQLWGNYAWGQYAAAMGLDFETAMRFNGLVKQWNSKSNSSWGSFYDFSMDLEKGTAYGQNPADAKMINQGYLDYAAQEKQREASSPARFPWLPYYSPLIGPLTPTVGRPYQGFVGV